MSVPKKDELVEWLTIMQHYGAPTRLIDITKSIFIAIYFALAETVFDNSSIWAIDEHIITMPVIEKYFLETNAKMVSHEVIEKEMLRQANEILNFEMQIALNEPSIFYITPSIVNERISRQQGGFLIPANISVSFTELLKSYYKNGPNYISFGDLVTYAEKAKFAQTDITILKINIPKELNLEIVKYLRAMNITSEVLFPGLDGLCRSLSYLRHEGMGNIFKM